MSTYVRLHARSTGLAHDDLIFTNNVIVDIQCVAITCNVTQQVLTCDSTLIRAAWCIMTWFFTNNVIFDILCVAISSDVAQ